MRRRHRRPHIWGSAGCDSFYKLWQVNGRGFASTVVDPYGSWRFLAILCRFLTFSFCRFWDVCGASGTRKECKKWCQESLTIIQQWSWNLGSTRFHGRREARWYGWKVKLFWRHLVGFVCRLGAHWISKGRSARCFSIYLVQLQKLAKSCIFKRLYC